MIGPAPTHPCKFCGHRVWWEGRDTWCCDKCLAAPDGTGGHAQIESRKYDEGRGVSGNKKTYTNAE